MHITLRYLRAALAVARHQSFRLAAEELHLTQPALSLAIGELERNLGVSLFDRTSRMVRTTELGEAFLASAGRLVEDLDGLVKDVGNAARSRRGRVVVACLTSIAGRLMPRLIRECERRYPQTEVEVRDELAMRLFDLVRFGEADLGLTTPWQDLHEELDFEPLLDDAFHAVFPRQHRLAAQKQVAWADLAGETFIAFATTAGSHSMIAEQLVRNRVAFRRSIAVSHLATVTGMLEAGFGVSILPRLALPVERHPTLLHRPLTRPALHRTIGLVQRKDRSPSPAARGFHEILREVVGTSI
jgi:DNA-binding transcriptional LysR family regulator